MERWRLKKVASQARQDLIDALTGGWGSDSYSCSTFGTASSAESDNDNHHSVAHAAVMNVANPGHTDSPFARTNTAHQPHTLTSESKLISPSRIPQRRAHIPKPTQKVALAVSAPTVGDTQHSKRRLKLLRDVQREIHTHLSRELQQATDIGVPIVISVKTAKKKSSSLYASKHAAQEFHSKVRRRSPQPYTSEMDDTITRLANLHRSVFDQLKSTTGFPPMELIEALMHLSDASVLVGLGDSGISNILESFQHVPIDVELPKERKKASSWDDRHHVIAKPSTAEKFVRTSKLRLDEGSYTRQASWTSNLLGHEMPPSQQTGQRKIKSRTRRLDRRKKNVPTARPNLSKTFTKSKSEQRPKQVRLLTNKDTVVKKTEPSPLTAGSDVRQASVPKTFTDSRIKAQNRPELSDATRQHVFEAQYNNDDSESEHNNDDDPQHDCDQDVDCEISQTLPGEKTMLASMLEQLKSLEENRRRVRLAWGSVSYADVKLVDEDAINIIQTASTPISTADNDIKNISMDMKKPQAESDGSDMQGQESDVNLIYKTSSEKNTSSNILIDSSGRSAPQNYSPVDLKKGSINLLMKSRGIGAKRQLIRVTNIDDELDETSDPTHDTNTIQTSRDKQIRSVTLPMLDADKIIRSKSKFARFVKQTSLCDVENTDPRRLVSQLSESLLDDCLMDVSQEICLNLDSMIDNMVDSELTAK